MAKNLVQSLLLLVILSVATDLVVDHVRGVAATTPDGVDPTCSAAADPASCGGSMEKVQSDVLDVDDHLVEAEEAAGKEGDVEGEGAEEAVQMLQLSGLEKGKKKNRQPLPAGHPADVPLPPGPVDAWHPPDVNVQMYKKMRAKCMDQVFKCSANQAEIIICIPEHKCGACKGDCNDDADCQGNLRCFQTEMGQQPPGCDITGLLGAGTSESHDYCYELPSVDPIVVENGCARRVYDREGAQEFGRFVRYDCALGDAVDLGESGCTPEKQCPVCYGGCHDDADCKGGARCFQMGSGAARMIGYGGHEWVATEVVQPPGCHVAEALQAMTRGWCYDPTILSASGGGGWELPEAVLPSEHSAQLPQLGMEKGAKKNTLKDHKVCINDWCYDPMNAPRNQTEAAVEMQMLQRELKKGTKIWSPGCVEKFLQCLEPAWQYAPAGILRDH